MQTDDELPSNSRGHDMPSLYSGHIPEKPDLPRREQPRDQGLIPASSEARPRREALPGSLPKLVYR
ncbi:hypothetical protein D3C76_1702030 [compost metagenome]